MLNTSYKFFMRSLKKESVSVAYESRGETLIYKENGRILYCSCTWHNGFRLYADSITNWTDSDKPIDRAERVHITKNILLKCRKKDKKIILVINSADFDALEFENLIYDKDIWSLCIGVEYVGIESKRKIWEGTIEKALESGEVCEINDIKIKSINDFRRVTKYMKLIDAKEIQ